MLSEKHMERLLTKLPQIIKDNTSLNFSEDMRKAVHGSLNENAAPDWGKDIQKKPSFLFLSMVAVVVIFFLLGGVGGILLWNYQGKISRPLLTQVETRIIDLDGEGAPEMVNTWKVKEGKTEQEKLVALIWERSEDGNWRVISSQSIQGGDFLPLEILKPKEQKGRLLVISASNGQEQVTYRVLGYDGKEVLPYLDRSAAVMAEKQKVMHEIKSLLPVSFEK